ncbi:hypothetical protein D3C72_1162350 [compost metagenome]
MFGEHAGDVVVDHHHLVGHAGELAREDAHGGRAAAHAHALFFHPVDDGRLAGLDDEAGAAVDGAFDRLLVAQQLHELGRHAAFLLAAAREVVHAAQRQHLRTVLGRGDMAHDLALVAHVGLLGAQEAVGVDLHLEAAVAEDAFGDDGDHVDALGFGSHDEGRGLVVGIRGGRAHAGDEDLVGVQQVAAPVGRGVCLGRLGAGPVEGHERRLFAGKRAAQQHHRVDAHQHALAVGVAVAGAGAAVGDLAQHRAGVALDLGGAHLLVARRRLAEGGAAGLGDLRHVHAGQSVCLGVFSHRGDLVVWCCRSGSSGPGGLQQTCRAGACAAAFVCVASPTLSCCVHYIKGQCSKQARCLQWCFLAVFIGVFPTNDNGGLLAGRWRTPQRRAFRLSHPFLSSTNT